MPAKSRTNTPEPTPARVTRSMSRDPTTTTPAGHHAARPQPSGAPPLSRSASLEPARANSSEPRGSSPDAPGRAATAYGATNQENDLALAELVRRGNLDMVEQVSAALDSTLPPTPSSSSTPATSQQVPQSRARQGARTSLQGSSESKTSKVAATTSSQNPSTRRTRQRLSPINEASELETATNTGNQHFFDNQQLHQAQASKPPTSPSSGFMTYLRFVMLYCLLPLTALFVFMHLAASFTQTSTPFSIGSYIGSAQSSFNSLIPYLKPTNPESLQLHNLDQRVQTLEEKVSSVFEILEALQNDVSSIRRELPDTMVVRTEAGKPTIPDDFWHALRSRLRQDGLPDEAWEQFLRSQKFKNSEYFRGPSNGVKDEAYRDWRQNHEVITREEVLDIIQENVRYFDDALKKNAKILNKRIESIAPKVTDEVITASSYYIANHLSAKSDFETLPHIIRNIARNTELALMQVNWFSVKLGAFVDPNMSSPTAERVMSLGQQLYWKILRRVWAHPHSMALQSWSEQTDCWCAAPVPEGFSVDEPKAQLTIDLPQPVYPKSITVEHMPAAGTTDQGAAPREMELWASIPDRKVRDLIVQSSDYLFAASWIPEDRQRRVLRLREHDLDESYVRIGVWTYDSEGSNHVQNFPLGVDVERWGASIRKVAVRAVSNHGGDFTCFYRLRLHGGAVEVPP